MPKEINDTKKRASPGRIDMRKTDKVIAITFVAIVSLILFMAQVAGDRQNVYVVPDFQGGLNVSTDGTGLQPDEALTLTNLTLDTVGVLVPRQGFSYYDSLVIKADSEIQAICVFEPYPDTQRMVIACGGFVYINSNLADPYDANWDTLRLSFTDDSLDVTYNQSYLTNLGTPWFYLKVEIDDVLEVDGDTSETAYRITAIGTSDDRRLYVSPNYKGANDTTTFTVFRKLIGVPNLAQLRNKLYASDGLSVTSVYNDSNYISLSLVDSGLVVDTVALDTSQFIYAAGRALLSNGSRIVYGNWRADWGNNSGIASGDVFIYKPTIKDKKGNYSEIRWSAKISTIDTLQKTLELDYPYETPGIHINPLNPYEIRREYTSCGPDGGSAVCDTNKNWFDINLQDQYLTGFYAVAGDSGIPDYKTIYCNDESTFTTNGQFDVGDRYYIFSGCPINYTDFANFPQFEMVTYYNDQLYGFGRDPSTYPAIGYNTVWYSDFALPYYIAPLYNFDLPTDDDIVLEFTLRNALYLASQKGLWGFNGTPQLKTVTGDAVLSTITSNLGIPDIDNWAKATEEYGYFANRTGVYRFDGVRPQKISWRVDPIIKNNYASRIVMGYQDYRLYVSFPDSNFTLVYDERFDAFYKLDFGMTCFYAPADTNIFYFGHSQFKGRVYYYPNGLFQDIVAIDDTNDIAIEYESGWQSHGGYWTLKIIKDMYFPVKSSNTPTVKIYIDFGVTPCDTVLCDSTGRFVYRKQFDNDCVGEYFKVAFSGSIDALTILGGYRIEYTTWKELQWQK